jgi:type IX secretion system PorP/SprF family membrane protein
MKRCGLILVLGFVLASAGWAQHFPVYSQYMMNGLAINPAYAGSREVLSATFLYREQWVGFEGAPGIFSLGAHMPFRNQRVALGVLVSNESIGLENNTSLYGNYAYRIQMGSGKLAFGLKAGFSLAKEQISRVTLHDPTVDKAFDDLKETVFMPNFGFGVYYSNSTYFAGLSLPSILSYRSGGQASTGLRTYNLLMTGGYLFKVNEQFKLKPSTLIKYKYESAPQFDINLNLIFFRDNILWIGGSYRNKESIVSLIEIQVSRTFRLGYSYDYSIGPLSKYNSGSHEIMLRWEWRDKVNTLNPLYF